jgi:hypothetical protein
MFIGAHCTVRVDYSQAHERIAIAWSRELEASELLRPALCTKS